MREFKKSDFIRTGNNVHFGVGYQDYRAIQLRHMESNKLIDILTDFAGNPLSEPDNITETLRNNIAIEGRHAKVVATKIDDLPVLLLIWPDIINN